MNNIHTELDLLATSIFEKMNEEFPGKSFNDKFIFDTVSMHCDFIQTAKGMSESFSSLLKERIKDFYANRTYGRLLLLSKGIDVIPYNCESDVSKILKTYVDETPFNFFSSNNDEMDVFVVSLESSSFTPLIPNNPHGDSIWKCVLFSTGNVFLCNHTDDLDLFSNGKKSEKVFGIELFHKNEVTKMMRVYLNHFGNWMKRLRFSGIYVIDEPISSNESLPLETQILNFFSVHLLVGPNASNLKVTVEKCNVKTSDPEIPIVKYDSDSRMFETKRSITTPDSSLRGEPQLLTPEKCIMLYNQIVMNKIVCN